jgi:dTDP-4-amino-4,6-dideoxygalactose transaminase
MCNGTIALEIVIRALDMKGEVIVPSFTFVATAHALQWQEITPVFCDIDPATYNIDPNQIERLITPRTTGIIGVHVWGRPCPIDEIARIAERRNLKVIYDAAHALGSTYHGERVGRFGDAEVLSFHATKFVNAFEGGAVLTNDDALAEKIRLMQNFGFSGYDNVIYIGTNGKMTEISAVMGLTNLESIDEFIAINKRNYGLYTSTLASLPGIRLVTFPETEQNNYQYVIVEIDPAVTGVTRDRIIEKLHDANILARKYFYPGCHKMEPYRSYFPNAGLLLPVTEGVSERVISLPTGTSIGREEIQRVAFELRKIIREASASAA